ncbi:phosphatidate cytidylyltransferase [Limibacillus halophilus]
MIDPAFFWLLGGIVLLLVVASVAGKLLALRAKSPSLRDTASNLNARIKAWWVMVALLAFVFVTGEIATLLLFAVISYMALREFITLTPTRPGDHLALFCAFFLVVPAQYLLIGIHWYGLFSILIPVYVFLFSPVLAAFEADTKDFLARSAKLHWGLMVAVYAISHAPALLVLEIPGWRGNAAFLLLYLILVVQLSDVLQYCFGKLLGKRKLAPKISPSKTVEGLLGGGGAAILVGTALYPITPFSPLQAAGMSFVIVAGGFFGGFVLSAVKRDLGAKDWGETIQGHGGVLDRLDSVAFAAPLFFHVTRYFFT